MGIISCVKIALLSDKHRFLLCIVTTLILVILGIYSHVVGTAKQDEFLGDLTRCISGIAVCPNNLTTVTAQIKHIDKQRFIVNIRTKRGARWKDSFNRKYDISVIGNSDELSINDVIALQGNFVSNQIMVLKKYETEGQWVRQIKYGISLLALGLSALIWFRTYRFSLKKFVFIRKEGE
jgi:hypothetical protein